MSALVRRAGDRHADPKRLGTLIAVPDRARLNRGAIILALADEIEARCPHGQAIAVRCEIGRDVRVSVPILPSWRASDLGQRFERAFGKPLVVRTGS